MEREYKRNRSDFWVKFYQNDDGSCTFLTSEKYEKVISINFKELEDMSPRGWTQSRTGDFLILWIPSDRVDLTYIESILQWLDNAVSEFLWLGLNRTIADYFSNELDYCIAKDFNFDLPGGKRTPVGEAEYFLKYHANDLSKSDIEAYAMELIESTFESITYLPIHDDNNVLVTPMPANTSGKSKIAWQLAEEVACRMIIHL